MWVPVDGGNGDPRCLTLCTSAMLVSCPLSDYATCVTECEYLCPCAAWDKYYSCAIAAQAWHCNEYGGPSPTGCDSVEQAAGDCVATGDPLHFCPGAAGAGGSG